MGTGAITAYIDVAQVVLYLFWIFFFGLIYYLIRENHREGYPMDSDRGVIEGWPRAPAPKTYRLADGREVQAPRDEPPQAHPRRRMTACPERQPGVEAQVDRRRVDRLAPRRNDPQPRGDANGRELRLGQPDPILVGDPDHVDGGQRADACFERRGPHRLRHVDRVVEQRLEPLAGPGSAHIAARAGLDGKDRPVAFALRPGGEIEQPVSGDGARRRLPGQAAHPPDLRAGLRVV